MKVSDFVSSFMVPLVQGGELHVGEPLQARQVAQMSLELGNATLECNQVDEGRERVLAGLVVRAPILLVGEDEMFLAAAIHNLLFLEHPDAESFLMRRRAMAKVLDTASYLAKRPLPRNRTMALSRHALLHNLFAITRNDLSVVWWTGRARYLGQQAPKRLQYWSSLRRIRREITVVDFDQLFASDAARVAVHSLLRRSPLTHLLARHRSAPEIKWEDLAWVLRDPELARMVVYEAIVRPERDERKVLPLRYAAAFEQMLERTPSQQDLRAVAAMLCYMRAMMAVVERDLGQDPGQSGFLAELLEADPDGQRQRGLTTFLALPTVLAELEPELSAPPGVLSDPDLGARWRAHEKLIRDALGPSALESLRLRLERRLGVPNERDRGKVA